jgi:hypothetical protein
VLGKARCGIGGAASCAGRCSSLQGNKSSVGSQGWGSCGARFGGAQFGALPAKDRPGQEQGQGATRLWSGAGQQRTNAVWLTSSGNRVTTTLPSMSVVTQSSGAVTTPVVGHACVCRPDNQVVEDGAMRVEMGQVVSCSASVCKNRLQRNDMGRGSTGALVLQQEEEA